MQTIVYIRTSTEEQNPENQLKDCLSLYNDEIGPYEVIEDKQSAFKERKRTGFQRLIHLIKRDKIKHLIVWDFDRIYRNRLKFKNFLLFLKHHDVKLHSYRQDWLEEINKVPEPWNEIIYEMLVQVIGWLAEEESIKKSDRIKASIRKKCLKCGKINYYDAEKCSECGSARLSIFSKDGKKWGRREMGKKFIKQIIDLKNAGKTYREIKNTVFYWKNGEKHYIPKGTISKVLKKYRKYVKSI